LGGLFYPVQQAFTYPHTNQDEQNTGYVAYQDVEQRLFDVTVDETLHGFQGISGEGGVAAQKPGYEKEAQICGNDVGFEGVEQKTYQQRAQGVYK
jgi:hypothetical protein